MTPSPIRRVLSTFRRHRVEALLAGGQACVLYGAAEFTRDVDFLIRPEPGNLRRAGAALDALDAETVYVPPLSREVLEQGHACHFRCRAHGVDGLRIDLMAVMRGCESFAGSWRRRNRMPVAGVGEVDVLSPPDLVRSKKTQRDKDWPMIARIVEADYRGCRARPPASRVRFWLLEARSVELLKELVDRFPKEAAHLSRTRAAVRSAVAGRDAGVRRALIQEQEQERTADERYWAPLRAQLQRWRHERRRRT